MTLYERVERELLEARRRRDSVALDTLGLLKSAVVVESKDSSRGGRIDDEMVVRIARKELKRREEAVQAYREAGREESAAREEREAELLRTFLPAQLSDEEIEARVREVVAELQPQGTGAFGTVMKEATARLQGRADGAKVAAAARRLLA